jgi:8-oxo-dGTP diphosphatase
MKKLTPGKDFIGVSVFALIVNNKNQVLLIKRHERNYWERPGGKVEFGEDTISALKREVLEETGIQIQINGVMDINEQIESKKHWIGFHYMAEYKKGSARIIEPKKHEAVKWFDIDKLPKLSPVSTRILKRYKEAIGKKK